MFEYVFTPLCVSGLGNLLPGVAPSLEPTSRTVSFIAMRFNLINAQWPH